MPGNKKQMEAPLKIFYTGQLKGVLHIIPNSSAFVLTGADESDIIIHNEPIQDKGRCNRLLKNISRQYMPYGKKVAVFIIDDYERRYCQFDNLILLRTSMRASKQRSNEILLPYIWESPTHALPVCEKGDKPAVAFCGLLSKHRAKIIRLFEKSPLVHCDFIKRTQFWGGQPHASSLISEFYGNMLKSQFVICNRGRGNFSIRFYQTLASGRIPVLVDTDMVLPFAEFINWNDLIVFEKNEKKCLEKVVAFFNQNDIAGAQKRCSQVHEKFFSIENHFQFLASLLRGKITANQ